MSHHTPPRAAVIIAATQEAMRSTGMTIRRFAADVVDIYHQRTHPDDRTVAFHATRDPYADERANAQLITRIVQGVVRLPADLEESWVLALPESHRHSLKTRLSARYGLLAVPMMTPAADPAIRVACLLRETAEAVVALAPMMRDGRLAPAGQGVARRAAVELKEVEAAAATLRRRLEDMAQDGAGAAEAGAAR